MMILSFVYSRIYEMNAWKLFSTFFKIGTFTFGGGYAMLPLIEQEVVHKQQWLNTEEYTEMLSLLIENFSYFLQMLWVEWEHNQ